MTNKKIAAITTGAWLAATAVATTSQATEAVLDQRDGAGIEEVVVTARKVEERLMDVPLSITAIGATTLEERNVESIADLASATPGVYFESFNAGSVGTPVIRGLSQQNLGGFDQQISNNVGRFIDGVYQTNRNAAELELLDIERVEVIKGPASALYGRATFSGAINVVTRAPGDELRGRVRGNLGSDDDRSLQFSLGGPIAGSEVRGRIAAGYSEFDGTTRNTEAPGDNVGGFETRAVTGSLYVPFGDATRLTLSAVWTDQDVEHSAQFAQTTLNCGTSAAGFTYYCGEADWNGGAVSISPEAFGARSETTQAVARLESSFAAFDLVATAAWAQSDSALLFDGDFAAGGALHPVCRGTVTFAGQVLPCGLVGAPPVRFQRAQAYNGSTNENEDLSFELRLQSTGDGALNWLVGAFAFDSDATIDTTYGTDSRGLAAGEFFATQVGVLTARPDPIGNPVVVADFDSGVRSWALFASLGYQFTDRLHGSIEGRYEDEKKTLQSRVNNFAPSSLRTSRSWQTFTPRATLDFRLTPDTLLYASAAQGARTGGFNASFPAAAPSEAFYGDESNWTYEAGLKATLLEQRLALTVAAFLIDWKDMQISGASSVAGFVGSVIRNTGGASSRGIELEARFKPTRGSSIGIGYAYANPEFDKGVVDRSASFQCAPDICTIGPTGPVVGGNRLPRTLEHQLTLDAGLSGRLTEQWGWAANVDYAWNDDVYRDSINRLSYGARSLLGAQLRFERDALAIALWGRNLLDDDYIVSGAFQPRSFSPRVVDYVGSQGRRVGVSVSYEF